MATKPTVSSVVTGQDITATLWNNSVYNANNFWINKRPVCVAYDTTAQTITNSTLTTVTFNSEFIDTDGMHSTVTNTSRVTIVTAGYYKVWGGAAFASNSTGGRGGLVKQNGTTVVEPTYTSSGAMTGFTGAVRLNEAFVNCIVGDYFELQVLQTSGGNLNTTATNGMKCYLAAEYFGDLA